MGTTFDQDDVFPVIARLIEARHAQHGRSVTHQELTEAVLAEQEGRRAVEEAQRRQHEPKSLEWTASNMVQWFSQRITEGESEWGDKFDREKIHGSWAYKPKMT